MILLAELDGKDWSLIIGAIGVLIMQILTWYKTTRIQTDVRKLDEIKIDVKDIKKEILP